MIHVLDIVIVFKQLDEAQKLAGGFEIDFHRGLGNLIKLGGNHFQPGGFEGFADGVEVGHGGLDFPHVALVAQIIGTGMLDVALAGVLLEKLHAAGAQPPVFDMMGE